MAFGDGLSEGFDFSLLEGIDWAKIQTRAQWQDLVRERFPAFAWALDHDELGPLLREAAEGDFTEATFDARLRATDWWTGRTASQRTATHRNSRSRISRLRRR